MKPRSLASRLALPASILIGSLAAASAASDTWNQPAGGPFNWNNGANWLSGTQFPNAAADVANVNIDIAAPATITLGQNIIVGTLNLGDVPGTPSAYTLTGNQLIFNNSGSNAALSSSGATNVINSAISLVDNLNISANSSLTLGGTITGANKSIAITGPGTVNFNGTSSDFGGAGSTITASSAGIIRTNSNSSFGGLGSASNKLILNGGTYFMGGSNDFGVSFNRAIEFQTGGTNVLNVNAGAASREGFFFSTLTGSGGFSTAGTSAALIIGKNDGSSTLSGTVSSGAQSIYVAADATRDALASADLNIQGGNFVFGGNSGSAVSIANFTRGIAVNSANGLGASNNYTFTHTGDLTGSSALSINNITVGQTGVGSVATINGAGANSVVVLDGNNSGFTGNVSVSRGTFRVGAAVGSTSTLGSVGTLSLTSGSTLGGNGTINRNATIASGVTLAAGASAGSLEFGGNLTLQANSTTAIELGGTAFNLNVTEQYDRIKMTGLGTSNLSLGGTLTLTEINAFTVAANQMFGIFQLEGVATQSGAFSNALTTGSVVTNLNGFDVFISYVANFGNSGAISLTGGNDIALYTIPEPSSALLLLGGLGMLLGRRRRRA